MKRVLFLVVAFIVLSAQPASASMATVSEFGPTEQGVPGPTFCLDEDDAHLRSLQGTLAAGESFTATERLCTAAESYNGYGSSTIGIRYTADYSKGQSINLYIVFPDGTVRQAHAIEGQYRWSGCVNPRMRPAPDYRPGGILVAPLMGGTYQIVLTNTGTKPISTRNPLFEVVWTKTMLIDNQQSECPSEDWNIEPA